MTPCILCSLAGLCSLEGFNGVELGKGVKAALCILFGVDAPVVVYVVDHWYAAKASGDVSQDVSESVVCPYTGCRSE